MTLPKHPIVTDPTPLQKAENLSQQLGIDVVQLENRVDRTDVLYETSGNVLLNKLLGAEIMTYPEGEDEAGADRALYERAEELKSDGRVPYVIPLGADHPPLGALGYVDCGREVLDQDAGFDVFVVSSGSGATHSGLLAGVRGAGSKAQVIGSCVRRPKPAQYERIKGVIERLKGLCEDAKAVRDADIVLWDGALAPGYGKIGPVALDAMTRLARSEGMFVDPVYTAKAFAAIPALVADGTIPQGARVCFVHTGGLAGLFAYGDVLAGML
jgi:1-aminocyclopropane-1-carboxylate deaminase/D-cysteine desulfhydrase-like pyridoxal-dependent ACC family enzyme